MKGKSTNTPRSFELTDSSDDNYEAIIRAICKWRNAILFRCAQKSETPQEAKEWLDLASNMNDFGCKFGDHADIHRGLKDARQIFCGWHDRIRLRCQLVTDPLQMDYLLGVSKEIKDAVVRIDHYLSDDRMAYERPPCLKWATTARKPQD